MADWLAAVEQMGAVQALKTSFVAYPLISALHIAAVGALLTTVLLMDLRLLGRFPALQAEPFVLVLRRVALVAFAVAAMTGVMLFSIRARDYAGSSLFLAKMGLIALAGSNFAAFTRLERGRSDGAPLSPAARAAVMLSFFAWPAVLLCGRFLGFV